MESKPEQEDKSTCLDAYMGSSVPQQLPKSDQQIDSSSKQSSTSASGSAHSNVLPETPNLVNSIEDKVK